MKPEKGKLYYPIVDKHGNAAYFLDQDKIHIYAWDGTPVAFVEKSAVFTFAGAHLGFYEAGWLRDLTGKCVGMAEAGRGGPNPPKAKHHEAPAEKKEPPEKPKLEDLPDRAPLRPAWSETSPADFFKAKKKK